MTVGVVRSSVGSLPSRDWTHACVQPVLTRCGVTTHQARATSRLRDRGQSTAAVRIAIAVAAQLLQTRDALAAFAPAQPADNWAAKPDKVTY